MKRIVRLIILLLIMVSIPSFSYAQNYRQEDVPNGSYIIGTYMFDKNKNKNYDGTLTTPMIMLASKSINSNSLNDMKIYYKNARGKWINAISGASEANVPSNFEITCIDLDCANAFLPTAEAYDVYTKENVGNGNYVIGRYMFDKNRNQYYDGTLTTPMIMLASKSINSNNLNDMKIYYKNARGKWINAISGASEANVPNNFEVTYVDLIKTVINTKQDDNITIAAKEYTYDGTNKAATFTTASGIVPTVTYYSDNTCTTTLTPKNVGIYYAKATTTGNDSYNAASLECTKAVTINKASLSCPTMFDYDGNYDKSPHTITVSNAIAGTIQYKVDGDWSTEKPTRTNGGTTKVYVRVVGDNNYNDIECGFKEITINKIADEITVLKGIYKYDGTVKRPLMNVISGLTPNITYYSDSTCSTKTTLANAEAVGGAPFAIGKYYMIAYTEGNENYRPFSLACREVLDINEDRVDDEIVIYPSVNTYDGNPHVTFYGSESHIDPVVTYYTDSVCTIKTTTANSGALSTGSAPVNSGTYYVTATTPGNENYNPAYKDCMEGVVINQREVTITAPTVTSSTLTYNNQDQIISAAAGSCTTGGTMYYYTKNYTTSSAPTFNTTDWSTTYPTVTGKNAGTYYMWYYCNVSDTVNNTGTDINTAKSVTKAIGKANNPISVTENQSWSASYSTDAQDKTFTAATNAQGSVTYSIKSQKKGSTTVTNFSIGTNTANKLTMAANTEVGTYTVVITASAAGNTNYKSGSKDITMTVTVGKLTDTINITAKEYTYDGNNKAATFTTTSGLTPTVTYYSNSICTTTATPKNAGEYYAIAETSGNDTYNAATLACSKAVTINQREVTVTAPTVESETLTYNGIGQKPLTDMGGCSTGGVMYWYTGNPTTDSTAPEFDLNNGWTKTKQTLSSYKVTDAGTYYMYYYCYVVDTTNNTGTNINTVLSVSKKIVKKETSLNLNKTSITAEYCQDDKNIITYTTDGDGTISCTSSDKTAVTCKVVDDKIKVTPVAKGKLTSSATIRVNQTAGTNYKATSATFNVTSKETIDYQDFISLRTTDGNDFYVMDAAHTCANKYEKPVVVTNGTYNIYKTTKTTNGVTKEAPIHVETSTDLGGSTIYIHDDALTLGSDNQVSADVNNYIYKIQQKDSERKVISNQDTNFNQFSNFDDIVQNTYDVLGYKYAYVEIVNRKDDPNINVFKRSGKHESDSSNGDYRKDAFRVKYNEATGKMEVLDDMFWKKTSYDASTILKVIIYSIPNDQLVFQNGTFKTVLNTNANMVKQENYIKRGINIIRSNVLLNHITHKYVYMDGTQEKLASENDYKINYQYEGFYSFLNAADVTFSNSKLYGLNASANEIGNSTYDLAINDVVNANIYNVDMYQNDENENQLTANIWGIMGTNYSKNITFDNCKLNRIDAHRGILNLTVKDSKIGKYSINVIGAGSTKNNSLVVNNVTVTGSNNFINLRSDYGGVWNGSITITNGKITPEDSSEPVYVVNATQMVEGDELNKLHNYGYDLYLPDVTVDGFEIKNNSVDKLYMIGIIKSYYDSSTKKYVFSDLYISELRAMEINNNQGFNKYFNPDVTISNIPKSISVYKFSKSTTNLNT